MEEFEVNVRIGDEELSIGETADSGIWIAPNNDTFWIIFINYDILLMRDGFIDIYFEVNVEPEPEPEPNDDNDLKIIGVDLFGVVLVAIGITSLVFCLKSKKKLKVIRNIIKN